MSVSLKRLDNAAEEFCHGKVDGLNDQKTQTASAFSVLDEDDPSPKGRLDNFLSHFAAFPPDNSNPSF